MMPACCSLLLMACAPDGLRSKNEGKEESELRVKDAGMVEENQGKDKY